MIRLINTIANRVSTAFPKAARFLESKLCVAKEILPAEIKKTAVLEKTPKLDILVIKNSVTPKISETKTIPPRIFPASKIEDDDILKSFKSFEHFDAKTCSFTEKIKPVIMRRVLPSASNKIIHISNSDAPYGTIAASTTLDKCLFTDSLICCAGLAVVDKKHNLQTLIHCFPMYSVKCNSEVIKYILEKSKPKDLEISVIPGIDENTGKTVSFLIKMVRDYAKGAKLNFCNFPNDALFGHYHDNRAVLMYNGEVMCCRDVEVVDRLVNPIENLIYCRPLSLYNI